MEERAYCGRKSAGRQFVREMLLAALMLSAILIVRWLLAAAGFEDWVATAIAIFAVVTAAPGGYIHRWFRKQCDSNRPA